MNDKSKQILLEGFRGSLKDIPLVEEPDDLNFAELESFDFDIPILTDLAADSPATSEVTAPAGNKDETPAPVAQAPITADAPDVGATADNRIRQPSLFKDFVSPGSPEADHLDRIVDELVAEYLPRLEHKLRIRLHDYLTELSPEIQELDGSR